MKKMIFKTMLLASITAAFTACTSDSDSDSFDGQTGSLLGGGVVTASGELSTFDITIDRTTTEPTATAAAMYAAATDDISTQNFSTTVAIDMSNPTAKSDYDIYINGGRTTTICTGNGEWDTEDLETKAAAGIKCDNILYVNGGEVNAKSTGSGGKGLKADYEAYITGGKIRVITTGGLYYSNGSTESHDYKGNTDNLAVSPAAILPADLKTTNNHKRQSI